MKRDQKTEELIKETARKVFQQKGFAAARTQDIADEAGINKALLHYYFRTKDQLFEAVFQEALQKFFPLIVMVLQSDDPVDIKIKNLVHTYIDHLGKNPYLPGFIIHELSQNPTRLTQFLAHRKVPTPEKFFKQVEDAIKNGEIIEIDPGQLLVSIVSQCVFPFVAKPMIQFILQQNENEFQAFIEKRKDEVTKLILSGLLKKNF